MQKDWTYHVAYWITALLPVLIGVAVTVIIVKVLEKKYKGPDDEKDKTH